MPIQKIIWRGLSHNSAYGKKRILTTAYHIIKVATSNSACFRRKTCSSVLMYVRMSMYRHTSRPHEIARRAAKAEAKAEQVSKALDVVRTLVLGASSLVGGSSSSVVVGRTDSPKVTPQQCLLLVKSLHLPSNTKNLKVGITMQKLMCVGSKIVLERQSKGLETLVSTCGRNLSALPRLLRADRGIHVSFTHCWDEVEAPFRFRDAVMSGYKAHATKSNMMVQKGFVQTTFHIATPPSILCVAEQWLCQPTQVTSTTASDIIAGITSKCPNHFDFLKPDLLKETVSKGLTLTRIEVGDRASGNLLALKFFGYYWEYYIVPTIGPKVLFFPDVCGDHLHHRAKMQVKDLKRHTMRAFSIANLNRLPGVREAQLERINLLVRGSNIRRHLGPAPENILDLRTVVDYLFDLDAPYHNRAKSEKSRRHQDLTQVCNMVNWDLRGEANIHYCHDPVTGLPCCANREDTIDKISRFVGNAMFGGSDPILAENIWTHVLTNLKQTLFRRLCMTFFYLRLCFVTKPNHAATTIPKKAAASAPHVWSSPILSDRCIKGVFVQRGEA